MGRYTFAKLGTGGDLAPDPYNTPLPLIEGDSSDAAHYWWTEIWSCNFGLTAAERTEKGEDGEDQKTKPKPKLGSVTLTKKVDWGSADLFQKCCEAPEAMKTKSDEDDAQGRINEVTIEVCRESGDQNEGKFPFLIATYKRVYITKYSVDFSGPDPTETIEFQYEEFKFEYVATDPYTGGIKKGGSAKSAGMANHSQPNAPASLSAAPSGSAAVSLAGSAAAAAMGGAPAAVGAPAGNGVPAGVASGADAAVAANFPGYASMTGNGVLPD